MRAHTDIDAYIAPGVGLVADAGLGWRDDQRVRFLVDHVVARTLVVTDAAQADQFGASVAMSGDTAVVGASSDDHGSPSLADPLWVAFYLCGLAAIAGIVRRSPATCCTVMPAG